MNLFTFFIGVAHAQTSKYGFSNFTFLTPIDPGSNAIDTAGALVSNLISDFLIVAAIAAFIYMLLGGFKYITSGGDSGKADEGRKSITNALVGVVIILLSYVVLRFVGTSLFGAVNTNSGSANTTTNAGSGAGAVGSGIGQAATEAQKTAAATQASLATDVINQTLASLYPNIFPPTTSGSSTSAGTTNGVTTSWLSNAIFQGFKLPGATTPTIAAATPSDCANNNPNVTGSSTGVCVDQTGNKVVDSNSNTVAWPWSSGSSPATTTNSCTNGSGSILNPNIDCSSASAGTGTVTGQPIVTPVDPPQAGTSLLCDFGYVVVNNACVQPDNSTVPDFNSLDY